MIIGLGCDVVEHQTVKELEWESDDVFLKRVFSNQEIELYAKMSELRFLAGRFAVKEAVVKCLKLGMIDGISLNEIETLQTENGFPNLQLTGEMKKLAEEAGITYWHVSLTHSANYSLAVVIGENRFP